MHENGDHDPGTSVEPLSEFVKLLTASDPAFADGDGHPLAGQPMPGPSGGRPMRVETTAPADPICIRLAGSRVAVGRPGYDNHVGIDDPLLASLHAVITQVADGTWWIDAMPSRNGVWIQVRSVELTDSCRFQCGEQRFMFVRP